MTIIESIKAIKWPMSYEFSKVYVDELYTVEPA